MLDRIWKMVQKILKKQDNIPDDLGAKFLDRKEADPRDFLASNILGAEEEYPDEVDLLKKYNNDYYINQGRLNSCTCASGYNILLQQLAGQTNNDKIIGEYCYTRRGMGHGCTPPDKGDYLEKVWKIVKKDGYKVNINNRIEYKHIDKYMYDIASKDNFKKYISKGYILHYAFRGNRDIWREMSRGEIKTTGYNPTGGHAVAAYGYDKNYIYFINSWKVNDGNTYAEDYSVFKIKWNVLEELIDKGLANRRFWIIDLEPNKEPMLFKDYKGEPGTEQYNAIKFLKDNGIVKGVPHNDGNYLEPGRPITRMEAFVLIFRIVNFLLNKR